MLSPQPPNAQDVSLKTRSHGETSEAVHGKRNILNLPVGRRFQPASLIIVVVDKDFSRSISRACGSVSYSQELCRHLVDGFLIQFYQSLRKKDFVKSESVSRKRKGKREYLNEEETMRMLKNMNSFYDTMLVIMRMIIGKRQSVETLINEEVLLLEVFT